MAGAIALRAAAAMLMAATAHAQSAPPTPPRSITVGSLTLRYCNGEYTGYCGSITQPLDRTGKLPGTINVGFEFYSHTDTSQPPQAVILAQEGGPGYSTTGSRDGYVRLFNPIRANRDILLVDKRGTGKSSVIVCAPLQHAYDPHQIQVGECARQLSVAGWFYRSADAANDVAAVLAALQLGPVDYYGDSYGTWFGQVFAVLHPGLVRTMILDSAYPVLNDHSDTEVDHGQAAMDIACRRSAPCAALGGSATARFLTLLNAVRAAPFSGTAPGQNGEPRPVTVNAEGLFLIIANAGNSPAAWRDLDAAGRAWLGNNDPAPLLRLLAEARDSYAGGGSAYGFSVGLADAVQCAEYGTNFNLRDPIAKRRIEYAITLARTAKNAPNQYKPFTFDEALHSQMNAEVYNSCLPWTAPPSYVTPGQAIPPGAQFPAIPVLVLSGELDTVTSPSEGRAAAALFPTATFIETPNLVHESAIGDAGVYTPPNGQDLSQCVGPIVRNFVLSGGATGDTSCLANIRPIRTVPAFATAYSQVFPATAAPGNAVDSTGLVLASAVAETVGDAMARYYVTVNGTQAGLRGGAVSVITTKYGYNIRLTDCKWTNDLTVSGVIEWHQITGLVKVSTSFTAPGHSGTETLTWNDQQTEAVATLAGNIDGNRLAATRVAP